MPSIRNLLIISLLSAAAIAVSSMLIFSSPDAEDDYKKRFIENYHVYPVAMPKELSFAGEKVPIENFEVRERIDRELLINTYWQSQTILHLKRAARWFPVIESIFKKNNIPSD